MNTVYFESGMIKILIARFSNVEDSINIEIEMPGMSNYGKSIYLPNYMSVKNIMLAIKETFLQQMLGSYLSNSVCSKTVDMIPGLLIECSLIATKMLEKADEVEDVVRALADERNSK